MAGEWSGMSEVHPFDRWWSLETGGRMRGSRYLARKAWNAALEAASQHVVPGGDREAIKALKWSKKVLDPKLPL